MHLVSWEHITKTKDEGGLGFRSMGHSNSAFLTKLRWRLLTEKEKLWSKVLRAKYCNSKCDVDMFKQKQDVSNSWKGILDNVNFLQQGLNAEAGNEERTLF